MNVFETLTPIATNRLNSSILKPYAQCYLDHLNAQGYARNTVRLYLNCLAHFAHWTKRQQISLPSIKQHISQFVSQHLPQCRCKPPVQRQRHTMQAALNHLLVVLAEVGVQLVVDAPTAIDDWLQSYEQHLLEVKGLARTTSRRRVAIIRPLVSVAEPNNAPTADQLRRFLRQELTRVSAASAGVTTAAVPERVNDFAAPCLIKSVCSGLFSGSFLFLDGWIDPSRSRHGFKTRAYTLKPVGRCAKSGVQCCLPGGA